MVWEPAHPRPIAPSRPIATRQGVTDDRRRPGCPRQADPATNGSRYTYEIGDLDNASDVSISLTGKNNSEWDNVSATRGNGETLALDVAGNADPVGPSANGEPTVTFRGTGIYHHVINDEGDGGRDFFNRRMGDYSDNTVYEAEMSFTGTGETLSELAIDINDGSSSGSPIPFDVYIVAENADGTYGEGTHLGTWNPSTWGAGEQTILSGLSYPTTSGQVYTVELVPNSDGDGSSDWIEYATDSSASSAMHSEDGAVTNHYAPIVAKYGSGQEATDPSIDVDGDGTAEASYSGTLTLGESVTREVPSITTSTDNATVSLSSGVVGIDVALKERTAGSTDPGVELNGNETRVLGTLNDSETVNATISSTLLREGTNNVTVLVGDGTLSEDAPDPQVKMTYRHDLTTKRSVEYSDEAFSERYNVSRTYLSPRQNATLIIPHADNVLSIRGLEARVNESGGWSEIPDSAMSMSGTTLTVDISTMVGGEVPADTTIEVRSIGSKIETHNGSVTVLRATPVGFDLDSRVRLDSWSSSSWIGVSQTPQSALLHYGVNESYSAENDYAEFSTTHGQRLYFPNASDGSEVGVQTAPLRLSPDSGEIHVSVPEDETNETAPQFYVEPGAQTGDSFDVVFAGASEGTWYSAFAVDTNKEYGPVQGETAISIESDDIGSVIKVRESSAPTTESDTGGATIFEAVDRGNIIILSVLFGAVGLLVVVGRTPGRSRRIVDGASTRLAGLVERIPRVGEPLSGVVSTVVQRLGDTIVDIGENEILTLAVAAAVAVGSFEAGLINLGAEAGAMLTVAGIAVGSLILLRRFDAFSSGRWIAIVATSGVVALQALGEGDLLSQLINSDAFVLVLLIVAYAVIQLVREYRANNAPDDDQPQINFNVGDIRQGDD